MVCSIAPVDHSKKLSSLPASRIAVSPASRLISSPKSTIGEALITISTHAVSLFPNSSLTSTQYFPFLSTYIPLSVDSPGIHLYVASISLSIVGSR